eukprot:4481-Prorocentrum_minimum.AAC.2
MAIGTVISQATSTFAHEYKKTPLRLQLIDRFLVFHLLVAVVQCVCAILVGSYPSEAFVFGLFLCVGSFVLTVSLRLQLNPENIHFKNIPLERAFAEYVLCTLLLYALILTSLR